MTVKSEKCPSCGCAHGPSHQKVHARYAIAHRNAVLRKQKRYQSSGGCRNCGGRTEQGYKICRKCIDVRLRRYYASA
jgi:hypothetical protein